MELEQDWRARQRERRPHHFYLGSKFSLAQFLYFQLLLVPLLFPRFDPWYAHNLGECPSQSDSVRLKCSPERLWQVSIGGRAWLRLARDLDCPFEVGAVFDHDSRGGHISDNPAVILNLDSAAGEQIASDLPVNEHIRGGIYT